MERSQIYFAIFLTTFFLTPTTFFFENDFQLIPEKINEKPYALHWTPEILCLLFFGMLLASIGQSFIDRFPNSQKKIEETLFLAFLILGSIVLSFNLLIFQNVDPRYFVGFFWGSIPLVGYLTEKKLISHAD